MAWVSTANFCGNFCQGRHGSRWYRELLEDHRNTQMQHVEGGQLSQPDWENDQTLELINGF